MTKMTADGRLPHWIRLLVASLACSACCAMPMASAVAPWAWLNGAPKTAKLDYGRDPLEVADRIDARLLSLGSGLHRTNETVAHPAHTQTVPDALARADVDDLMTRLQHGQAALCCGHWQQQPAAALRSSISSALGVTSRQLGDVHLSSESVKLTATVSDDSMWGSVVALFLEPTSTQAKLVQGQSTTAITLKPGEAVVVPEGAELLLDEPRSVAWLHMRRAGKSARSLFEYYFVAGVRAHFVAPHDTEKQRKFFRTLTKHPRYWHGFMWSFFGMIVSIFAMWPLVKKALSYLESLIWETPKKDVGMPLWTDQRLPTLLSRGLRPDLAASLSEKQGRSTEKVAFSETLV